MRLYLVSGFNAYLIEEGEVKLDDSFLTSEGVNVVKSLANKVIDIFERNYPEEFDESLSKEEKLKATMNRSFKNSFGNTKASGMDFAKISDTITNFASSMNVKTDDERSVGVNIWTAGERGCDVDFSNLMKTHLVHKNIKVEQKECLYLSYINGEDKSKCERNMFSFYNRLLLENMDGNSEHIVFLSGDLCGDCGDISSDILTALYLDKGAGWLQGQPGITCNSNYTGDVRYLDSNGAIWF